MLTTILNLFAKSPFAPLTTHMERVSECVHKIEPLFIAIDQGKTEEHLELVKSISELEHYADITKNEIRNHMPRGLFLPIDRGHLLDILALQDALADAAQDVAILTTFKSLKILPGFKEDFWEFLNKNLEAFDTVHLIIKEMHELLESAFGGIEAEKVRNMIHQVAYKEHEVDLIQRRLVKHLYESEDQMNYTTFYLWDKVLEKIGAISNISENLGNRVRMTLELK